MRRAAVWSICGLYLAFVPALQAQQADLDSLRRAHVTAQDRVSELISARDSALSWAETRYRAIAAARQEGGDALRDALRAAQVAADSLATLDARLAEAMDVEKRARLAFTADLEAELEVVLIRAELEDDRQAKGELLARARALAVELTRVQEPLELPITDVPQVSVEPSDGPEEIALKADFLADRAAQLRHAAEVVESEVKRRTKRAELQTEMRRLVAEVRLFDQARVPPAGTQAGDEPLGTGDRSPQGSPTGFPTEDARSGSGSDESNDLINPLLERGVDLPGNAAPTSDNNGRRTVTQQLRQLRVSLLRRAESLEARAEAIRAMLRGPP